MQTQPLLDFSADTGNQLLHAISIKHHLPDYVRQATEDDVSTAGHGDKCASFDPTPRFPTHTPAATWLSYACLLQQRNAVPEAESHKIANQLRTRAFHWGIVNDIERLDREDVAFEKEATASDEKYPVRNEAEAKAASEWLQRQLNRGEVADIPLDEQVNLARKVASFDVHSDAIDKLLCYRGCYDGKKLANKIAAYAGDRRSPELQQLCAALPALPPRIVQQYQHKIATALAAEFPELKDPIEFTTVNTKEDVAFLLNGAVVKLSSISEADGGILYAGTSRTPMLRGEFNTKRAAESLDADLADALCEDLYSRNRSPEVAPAIAPLRVLLNPAI